MNETFDRSAEPPLKVAYLPVVPWSVDIDKPEFGGIFAKIVKLFTEKSNTSYEGVESNDWMGSMKQNGKWTGIMKALEMSVIDIIAGPVVITHNHVEEFHVLPFVYQAPSYLTLASTTSQKEVSLFSFLQTFDNEVWYGIGVAFLILIIASSFIDKVVTASNGKLYNLGQTISRNVWTYVAAFFYEGSPRSPDSVHNRFIFGIWLLAMIVLLNSFSGQFKALLMVSSTGEMLEDVHDLAGRPEFMPQFPNYYSFWPCFRDTDLDSYQKIWKTILKFGPKKVGFTVPEFHHSDLYQRVKNGQTVLIADPLIIKKNFAQQCRNLKGTRTMYYFYGVCNPFSFAFLASPGLSQPLRLKMHKSLRYMVEGHLIERWMNEESRDLWKCFVKPDYNEATPLSMSNLSGSFVVFFLFQVVSFFAFVGELIYYRIYKLKSEIL